MALGDEEGAVDGDGEAVGSTVGELEALVLRLTAENDRLTAAQAATLLDIEAASMQEMQPA